MHAPEVSSIICTLLIIRNAADILQSTAVTAHQLPSHKPELPFQRLPVVRSKVSQICPPAVMPLAQSHRGAAIADRIGPES